MHTDNRPQWENSKRGFYEVWYFKLNVPSSDPKSPGAGFWFRFTTLSNIAGLKKQAETWAIFFEPSASGTKKIAIKNTASNTAYQFAPPGRIQIEDSYFDDRQSQGRVVSRGNDIQWDLRYESNEPTFFHVPKSLERLRLTKSVVCKPNLNLKFTGWFSVNGKRYDVADAPGCQGHIWGTRQAHDWAWAHCNSFIGAPDVIIELLTARVKMANLVLSPPLTAICLQLNGERIEWNRLRDLFSVKSEYSLQSWRLSAERGDLRILVEIECDLRSLAGVTYEDPLGEFLYCYNTELASMRLSIYRRGSLETTYVSTGTTAFETVSRQRSQYAEILL